MRLFEIMDTTFDRFDQSVRTYLAKTFSNLGLQYSHSQIFGVIFDGMKGIMQNIMFYIEDALNEQNIFTATRKKSVYSLAKLSGYEPFYGSAPTGILIGKLQVNNGLQSKTTKVYIRNHSKVINKTTGVTYSIILPSDFYVYDVSKPLVTHEFKIIQGYFNNASYVASGVEMETMHINTSELFDKEYLSVKVNGEVWDQVSNFYDMTDNGHEYMIQVGYDNTFDVVFGNGVYGKRLNEGDTVSIEYLSHQGTLGNILPNAVSDFIFSDYSYDSVGNSVNSNNYMTLSMETCVSGGTNSDSIDFIRKMIGTNSRSLVLASEDNFKLFFKRFSYVGYVNCWSETNSMVVIATCLKNFASQIRNAEDYYSLTVSDMLLSDDQKEMIQNTLNNSKRAFAGITLKFQDPVIRKFAFMFYIKPDSTFSKDIITESVKNKLAVFFMKLDHDADFIPKSDIINYLTSTISQIKSIDFDIISDTNEQAYKKGWYEKYSIKFINGSYNYVSTKSFYEKDSVACLDNYGNIKLDTKLEVPVLAGGFRYYSDKEANNNNDSVMIEAVNMNFI